jgi:hypothetical protein
MLLPDSTLVSSPAAQLAVVNVGKRQSHVPANFLDAFWRFKLPQKIGFVWSRKIGSINKIYLWIF